ncbi:MAG: UbiH/UbiF/VisC/COQ6 family ubiquinone biosynthesis hydroxylase [Gammaproteobacteria bacterium]|nr:UbiH/UbiF/VisC/COQ6 family ubiquinone biosynthesis hydroxylase [Gammaproteobacteria bacterium]MCW5582355.1 UbiH/UbiF/VisC/COQ6 family ubiquinone biosynthesis hydroxylase [Gammaproteobacteria bacterium]
MQSTTHDIIIVGGGMVGLALACMLAQRTSLTIAVLEVHSPIYSWSASCYHHRVSAIALSSQRIFQSLHVWGDICDKRVSPFTQIQVWDAVGKGKITFDSEEIAEPWLGHIIENNLIQSVLKEKISQYLQVKFISPVQLIKLTIDEQIVELESDNGNVYKGKLAVAADGANSWLREAAKMDVEKRDYHQAAIVAAVQTSLPHGRIARQIFLDTGPLAFLPLADEHQSSIVWSLPLEKAQRLMSLDEVYFQHALAEAFENCLGEIPNIDERYVFPLFKQQATEYVKPRLALVGDAAHTVHPLAGQGVNMGLLDAASLSDVIVEAVKNHRDIGNYTSLRRYERWRKADNFTMLAGVDVIKNLFASNKKSIQQLRSLGLKTTHQVKWMKNLFTRHAVGNRNGLPFLSSKV